MSEHGLQHLIKMVNQISVNMAAQGGEDQAAEQVAGHLKKFWARSMKEQIIDYAERDGSELAPLSKRAVEHLKAARKPS
ncbi:Formate dehydrogenase delta subunit [Alloalcanivorax dieselolei B5]|uniref:Formate dehydrogenase delta subunit n=1 Tax=Alcanivorax dieselolei (strain DSM 16502 / CGMCC 1.3690 / MCCC 1A00001 / B-5) TaxID=930169 RepID=K0CHM7_ALCDB|nr:formate dehydrogenase subunit delta [Alloalcanivorax dieselolei]AFT71207.1 Formate dehydrogenase delta subunit [Alloalcanivorax dieselolei B5]GGJ93928.1 hypothetical protein GCM10007426_23630 [Alloalcanivorax dieselolei]